MNRILLLGGLLLSLLGTVGCACFGPGYGYGYGNIGAPCSGVIAPYSCGPSSCGGMGTDYVDGGPGACDANCGGNYGYRGPQQGYLGNGDCTRCITNGLRTIGEGAVGLVAAPFVLAGSLLNCGSYGTFNGCGCSNEVYRGDNCYQPHDFCDPCGGNVGPERIGHTYPPTTPGCGRCSGGYSEGIQARR